MAIFESPILGKIRKSIAGNTFAVLNGQNILKTKVTSIRNPKTPGQQRQREGFDKVVELWRVRQSSFRDWFPQRAQKLSAFNRFTSLNLDDALDKTGSETTIDFTKVTFSDGTMPTPSTVTFTNNNDGTAAVNLGNITAYPGVLVGDSVIFYWLDTTDFNPQGEQTEVIPSSGALSFTVNTGITSGTTVNLYALFLKSDKKRASKTLYVGQVVFSLQKSNKTVK